MGDFAGVGNPNLVGIKLNNRRRFSVQGHKFHFKGFAASVDKYNNPNVTGQQAMFFNGLFKNNSVMFLYHFHSFIMLDMR